MCKFISSGAKKIAGRAGVVAVMLSLLISASVTAVSGDLDPTFSRDGRVIANYVSGKSNGAYGIAIQPNGRIVVVGDVRLSATNSNFGLARFITNGNPDPTFSGDGLLSSNLGYVENGADVVVQPDGKILASGRICVLPNVSCDDLVVVRYTINGALDKTFDYDGKKVMDPWNADNGTDGGLALQTDGYIVVAGYMLNDVDYDFEVHRLEPGGSSDMTFGTSMYGTVVIPFRVGSHDRPHDLAIQGDGRILIAGETCDSNNENCDFALARLNTDGSLDASFRGTGKVMTNFGASERAYGLALQPDGKIVVVGERRTGSTSSFVMARYNANGSPDTTFNGTGRVITNFSGDIKPDYAKDVIIQSNGRIVVLGSSLGKTWDFAVARYLPSGVLDTTFSLDGKVTVDFGLRNDKGEEITLQADGKYVLIGTTFDGILDHVAMARVLP